MTRTIDSNTRCTLVKDWPVIDATAWAKAQEPADELDPSVGYATRWRPSTRMAIENGYGRWLGWLERTRQLEAEKPPGARVNGERVRAYRDMLLAAGNADNTIAGRLQQLCNALRAVAPEGDWTWIHKASSRMYSRAIPTRDILARMQPAEAVAALGCDLMRGADNDRFRMPCERALMFRDGLLLAFLIQRPLRMANLASITLGQHLERRADQWRLSFSNNETKQGEMFEVKWPDDLVEALERYLAKHRPQLMLASRHPRPTQALWVSQRGTAMGMAAISFQINDRTREEFGTAINPHTFRHIAATTIASSNPQGARDIMAVLGHASMTASEKFYNRAGTLAAGAELHKSIANLRNGEAKPKRKRQAAPSKIRKAPSEGPGCNPPS